MTMYDGASNTNTAYATIVSTGYTTGAQVVTVLGSEYGVNYAWQAFDQNTSTLWTNLADPPQCVAVKFGGGVAKLVNKYWIHTYGGIRFPTAWVLQGSNDDTAIASDTADSAKWTTVDTRAGITDSQLGESHYYFTFSSDTIYKSYRLYMTASNNVPWIYDLKLVEQIIPIESDTTESSESTDSIDGFVSITVDVSESSETTDAVNGSKDQEIEDVVEASESTDSIDVYQDVSICDVQEVTSDITLLLHMDGSNGGTTFTDSSSYGHTVTAIGAAETNTSQSVFGGASLYTADVTDYLEVAPSGVHYLGFGDWTIEFRFRCSGDVSESFSIIERLDDSFEGGNSGYGLHYTPDDGDTGYIYFTARSEPGVQDLYARCYPPVVAQNVWVHIALVLRNGVATYFFDGVALDTETLDNTGVSYDRYFPLRIGASLYWAERCVGYIDELVIYNTAKYIANFTVTVAETLVAGAIDTVTSVVGADVDVTESSTSTDTVTCLDTYVVDVAEASETTDAVEGTNTSVDDVTGILSVTAEMSIVDITGAVSSNGSLVLESGQVVFAGVGLVNALGELVVSSGVPEFAGEGLVNAVGSLAVVSGVGSFAGVGLVNALGELAVTSEVPAVALEGLVGAIGGMACETRPGEFSAGGWNDLLGTFAVITSVPAFSGAGLVENAGTMAVTAEFPSFAGVGAVGSTGALAVTTQSFIFVALDALEAAASAYCFNLLKKGLVSTFTNYGFNSLAVINGVLVGANTSGMFNLSGELDVATAIASTVEFPLAKFGTTKEKQLRAIKLFGRGDGDLLVTANDGKSGSWAVAIPMTGDDTAESLVGYFPFTARGRYLQAKIENVSGSDFLLDQVELSMYILGRA